MAQHGARRQWQCVGRRGTKAHVVRPTDVPLSRHLLWLPPATRDAVVRCHPWVVLVQKALPRKVGIDILIGQLLLCVCCGEALLCIIGCFSNIPGLCPPGSVAPADLVLTTKSCVQTCSNIWKRGIFGIDQKGATDRKGSLDCRTSEASSDPRI